VIVELAKAGMSISRISESNKIGKTTVYYHARAYCRKMSKIDLTLLDDSEKGYIIGLFLGDGSFNRGRKTPRYVVRFALDARRDQDVASKLVQILQKARKRASVFRRESTLLVKVCSKELVRYIQTSAYYRASGDKRFRLDRDWSSAFQYGVVAGIVDSDGHVHEHLGTEIKTVSPSLFEAILNLLGSLGMTATTKKRTPGASAYSQKTSYALYISSLQMRKHGSRIPSVKLGRLRRQIL
jgi:hypothetical protein